MIGLYPTPEHASENLLPDVYLKEHIDKYYEDLFLELTKYGQIDELHIAANLCEHLLGGVFVKFIDENDAEKAHQDLNRRFYEGKAIVAQYSPVTNFRAARCQQFEEGGCSRGAECNYLHVRQPSPELAESLYRFNREFWAAYRKEHGLPEPVIRSQPQRRRAEGRDGRGDRRDFGRRDDRWERRESMDDRHEHRRDDRRDERRGDRRDDRRDDNRGYRRDDRRDDRREDRWGDRREDRWDDSRHDRPDFMRDDREGCWGSRGSYDRFDRGDRWRDDRRDDRPSHWDDHRGNRRDDRREPRDRQERW
ncbi:U2 auxiliary factor small subunit [Carpediemonas membranifera]|uniref:U2 auxiliary factor small subunit n=1 Tax=Carpediemonas membranifera TaxID=201153 RepID=A0A8J6AT30_9EUKA|nr:U2 auxiliary factor small subunit [Carpediemonas membranifera]|eukprot:KAG9393811.1 U2 auxiliary factor small subunit [Carpediemonas membranifera]